MAAIAGTAGNDTIAPGGVSAGVTGGVPSLVADSIRGLGGNDSIDGGGGTDSLFGGAGNDTLTGGTEGDTLFGGSGVDVMDGGAGYDLINFVPAAGEVPTQGVVASLATGLIANDGYGNAETMVGGTANTFEMLIGTGFADDLAGRLVPNERSFLRGGQGADTLRGVAGDATVGVMVDYRDNPGSVWANLSDAAATLGGTLVAAQRILDGWGTADTIQDITGVFASLHNDTLLGGAAADRLHGYDGNDSLAGGAGDDTLGGGRGTDTYDGGAGFDLIVFGPYGSIEVAPTQGVVASLLTGLIANDGYGNAESLEGGATNTMEMLIGHSLNDDLTGKVIDQAGAFGQFGPSFVRGNAGNDTLRAATGDDRWIAADYARDPAAVTVNLATQLATDGWGNTDQLVNIGAARGSIHGDTLIGNDGANWFGGEGGNDTLTGAGGVDLASYFSGTGSVVVDLAAGTAEDGLGGTDSFTGIEQATGSATASDTLRGSDVANLLYGYGGDDLLEGRADADTLNEHTGNDTLDGGSGADSLAGGADNDLFIVDDAGDTTTELADEGTDTVQASLTWTLAEEVENLTLTGTARSNGTGNAAANHIIGNGNKNTLSGLDGNDTLEGGEGTDKLDGGTGADSMAGGGGKDSYTVDDAGDSVTELADGGTDTVKSSVTFTLSTEVEHLQLTGPGAINGFGNALNNTLTGNNKKNRLEGAEGRDVLDGSAGNDTLLGGAGNDTLLGGAGADSLEGGADADVFRWLAFTEGGDAVADFVAALDDLEISAAGFASGLVAGGPIGAAQFEANGTGLAATAAARFVYNTATGELMFDVDGSGGAVGTLLATFTGAPTLSAADIMVIG